MTKIFVFTAGKPEARTHLDDSIKSPVDFSKLETTLDNSSLNNLINLIGKSKIFCWGAMPGKYNPKTWEQMEQGDFVFCVYNSRYKFISRLKAKINSFDLAKSIWGEENGNTWQYIYFLSEPISIDYHLSEISMGESPIKRFGGFACLAEERLKNIEENFLCIEQFIEQNFKVTIPFTEDESISLDDFKENIDEEIFNTMNIKDSRSKLLTSICKRQGQPKFRKELLKAYDGKCTITSCSISEILEAAHIIPYKGSATNHVQNGLLLRADIHTLFDLGLLKIDSNYTVHIDKSIEDKEYQKLNGKILDLPFHSFNSPSKEALYKRFENIY